MRLKHVIFAVLNLGVFAFSIANASADASASPNWTVTADDIQRSRDLYNAYTSASSMAERNSAIEALADEWAARYAQEHGWSKVWQHPTSSPTHPQGIDQIWQRVDGELEVLEVKGGSSRPIQLASGAKQGEPAYFIERAQKTMTSSTAPAAEKEAAQRLLRAAADKKVRFNLMRVTHADGVAKGIEMEKTFTSSTESARRAKTALGELEHAAKLARSATEAASAETKLATGLRLGGGALGVAGGGFQVKAGIDEIREGKTVEGAADVIGGVGNTASGMAIIANAAAVAGPIGGVTGLIDGGKDIYVGVKSGNVEKTSVGGVKTLGSGMMLAGAATAQPQIVFAGAVVYGGAVVYDNREAIAQGARAAAETCADVTSAAYDSSRRTVNAWASDVQSSRAYNSCVSTMNATTTQVRNWSAQIPSARSLKFW